MDWLNRIKLPATKVVNLRVHASAERLIKSEYPWLFEQAIVHQSHHGEPGDWAVVFSEKIRKFIQTIVRFLQ